MNLTRAY